MRSNISVELAKIRIEQVRQEASAASRGRTSTRRTLPRRSGMGAETEAPAYRAGWELVLDRFALQARGGN